MACMEHSCSNPKCNFVTFNNDSRRPWSCPLCGSDLSHFFDEQYDHYDSREPYGDEEDEEE